MSRAERRAVQKSWKRRLRWLEEARGDYEIINKAIVNLEENFDQDEIEAVKVFAVDLINWSGPLSRLKEPIHAEDIVMVASDYGLDHFDALFVMSELEELSPLGELPSPENNEAADKGGDNG